MRLFSVYVAFFMLNSVALLIGTGIGMLVYEADFSEFDRFYIPGTWKSALLDMCCAFGTTMVPLYFALINRLFCKKVSFWKSDELRIFPVRCLRVRYPVIYGILAVVLVVFLVTIPYLRHGAFRDSLHYLDGFVSFLSWGLPFCSQEKSRPNTISHVSTLSYIIRLHFAGNRYCWSVFFSRRSFRDDCEFRFVFFGGNLGNVFARILPRRSCDVVFYRGKR